MIGVDRMEYKVEVDRNLCIACGVAPLVCPQVFVLGEDNGKNVILEEYSEETSSDKSIGVVPEGLYDCVSKAADACPVQAIKVKGR
jgi:ferredoxin